MISIVSFVGRSNSGKTTHLEKVIREIKNRGYKVATIKHHTHNFEIDIPGKDTWKHAQAGADTVVISSPNKMAIIEQVSIEKTIDEIASTIQNVDIILTEGYKSANKPKVEILRQEQSSELICHPKELIAVITDINLEIDIPTFNFQEVKELVDLLEIKYINKKN